FAGRKKLNAGQTFKTRKPNDSQQADQRPCKQKSLSGDPDHVGSCVLGVWHCVCYLRPRLRPGFSFTPLTIETGYGGVSSTSNCPAPTRNLRVQTLPPLPRYPANVIKLRA